MEYPITLARDTNGTVLVRFLDFPEAHTFGEDIPDALRQAPDALATVIDAYIKDRRDLPLPSAVVTKYRVTVPALIEAKMRLYETMRTSKVGKSELAKRLAKVRNAIKALEWDRSMTPAEKRAEIRAYNEESQALVEAFRQRLAPERTDGR